jgi:hypothetical protein
MSFLFKKSIDGTQVKIFESGRITIVRFNQQQDSRQFIAEMCHVEPTTSLEQWIAQLEPSDEESFLRKMDEFITHIRLLGVEFDKNKHKKQ